MTFLETTWRYWYGCTLITFSFSRRMLGNTNDTSIWYMNYYSDGSYFPASINQRSSRLESLFADTSSIKMEYTSTPKISRSSEVGLRRPVSMTFDNLSGFVGFTSSLSKDSRL